MPPFFINALRPKPQPHEEPQEHPTAHPHDDPAPQQASDQQGHPPPRHCPGAPGAGGMVGRGERDGGVVRLDIRIIRYQRVVSSFGSDVHVMLALCCSSGSDCKGQAGQRQMALRHRIGLLPRHHSRYAPGRTPLISLVCVCGRAVYTRFARGRDTDRRPASCTT
jgi:hypothetical protein